MTTIRKGQVYRPTNNFAIGDPSTPSKGSVYIKSAIHFIEVVEVGYKGKEDSIKIYLDHIDSFFGERPKCSEKGMYVIPTKMLEDDCVLGVALTLKLGKWYMEHEKNEF